jgi:5'-nucleotidase
MSNTMDRRTFLKTLGKGVGLGSLVSLGIPGLGRAVTGPFQPDRIDLTILYTNDTHSSVQPGPQGEGGLARRAAVINKIRRKVPHTLLLDAGDVFQGTPWFQRFGGGFQFRMMSKMGYQAMVLGNHEFDHGMETLADAIRQEDNFPLLAANYDVSDTPLNGLIQPFTVLEYDSARVGVFGLGIALDGLVDDSKWKGLRVRNPITVARGMVRSLRTYKECDVVIALSHLGYDYPQSQQTSDRLIARRVEGIDLIIGGHTHTELERPERVEHSSGWVTTITQAGSNGTRIGRLDVQMLKDKENTEVRV